MISFVCALLGCNANSEANEGKGSAEELLFSGLESAYEPLRLCVEEKLPSGRVSQGAAIVDEGLLPRLEVEAKKMLGPRNAEAGYSVLPAGSDAVRANSAIDALSKYDSPMADQDSYGYKAYRLRRHVAADVVLGSLKSVSCPVSEDLLFWMKEADDQDVFINLATAYFPFQQCTDKFLESYGAGLPGMHAGMLKSGLGGELEVETAEILGEDNQFVVLARAAKPQSDIHTKNLITGLATYGTSVDGERYEVKTQRLLAMVTAKKFMALSLAMNCAPSEELLGWMEIAKHENH